MSGKSTIPKQTKTQLLAEDRFHHLIAKYWLMDDTRFLERARYEIPEAWLVLEQDIEVEAPKEKVTLYLDKAVIAMFRKMGKGYQARINRILETWMQMRMSGKMALRRSIIEQLEQARKEIDKTDLAQTIDAETEKLVEYWAYTEGWHAALKSVGRAPGTQP